MSKKQVTKHLAACVAGLTIAAASQTLDQQNVKLGALEADDGYMLTQANQACILMKAFTSAP